MNFKSLYLAGLGILLFILWSPLVTNANEQNGTTYTVGIKSVELKDTPDANGQVIVTLHEGSSITIFQESYGWGRTFFQGEEAWVPIYQLIRPQKDDQAKEQNNQSEEESEQNIESEDIQDEENVKNQLPEFPEAITSDLKIEQENIWKREDGSARRLLSSMEISREPVDGKALQDYHILLDPGHGGKDSGAMEAGVYEKDITLHTAKETAAALQEQGATVTMTRDTDQFISLEKCVQQSNQKEIDAFISLHINAFEDPAAQGLHTFYHGSAGNKALAEAIQTRLVQETNLSNRGVATAAYYVLRNNTKPAVLVELGFLTNQADRELIQSKTFQQQAAKAITTGLVNYFHD